MKKSDLSARLQKLLVPVELYPGAFALVPPATPRSISSKTISLEVTRAHEALGALRLLSGVQNDPDIVLIGV